MAPIVAVAASTRQDFPVGSGPTSLVVAGDRLVWTDMAGAIWTMPAEGGTPKELSNQHSHKFAFHPVLAGTRVFATTKRDLYAVTLPDGPVTALGAKLPEDPEQAIADDQAVYVTLFKREEILRIPLDGQPATRLAFFPRGVLAVHGDTLFLASYSTGELASIPRGGGKLAKIAGGFHRPTAIAADDTYAFVYSEVDKSIQRVTLATHEITTLATGLVNADELALDDDAVYTASWDHPARVLRIAKSGGRARTLAGDLATPRSLTLAGPYLWLTDRDRNLIARLPK
jgi:hypothetical protein